MPIKPSHPKKMQNFLLPANEGNVFRSLCYSAVRLASGRYTSTGMLTCLTLPSMIVLTALFTKPKAEPFPAWTGTISMEREKS